MSIWGMQNFLFRSVSRRLRDLRIIEVGGCGDFGPAAIQRSDRRFRRERSRRKRYELAGAGDRSRKYDFSMQLDMPCACINPRKDACRRLSGTQWRCDGARPKRTPSPRISRVDER
jgi:hypothetical protein